MLLKRKNNEFLRRIQNLDDSLIVDEVAQSTTILVVAHRLSTIKKADCIYVIDEGKIVESGSYNELVKTTGYFNSMVQLQELEVIR